MNNTIVTAKKTFICRRQSLSEEWKMKNELLKIKRDYLRLEPF
jgi:hypothetical protein